MHLLPSPRAIDVTAVTRRGFPAPVQYLDNGVSHALTTSLGPQCLSGDHVNTLYDREYYQGVRNDGSVVLMFRERSQWYLAGCWD